MTSPSNYQATRGRYVRGGPGEPAWAPLYVALRDAIDWALDLAATIAAPYPEEVVSVENVRAFVRARAAGLPVEVDIDDVLLVLGIVIAAIDRPVPRCDPPMTHYCPGAESAATRGMPLTHYLA